MTVVKQHFSSFSRQIHESILIFMNKQNVLNSRSQFNRCQVPRLTVMLDDNREEKEALNVGKVDKEDKLKRKRTEKLKLCPSVSKRPRMLSVTPGDVRSEMPVSCDQGVSSSTHSNKKLFNVNSQRMSRNEEDKLGPQTKISGASNNKLAKGAVNDISIKNYFKPVLGKASAANNSFYPPD